MKTPNYEGNWKITFKLTNGAEKNFRMEFAEDGDAKSMYQHIREAGYVIENY